MSHVMRLWKLAVPAIFACACTTTIEGPPLDDGIADDGTTSGTASSGGANPPGASATGGNGGTASTPANGGASSNGAFAGSSGAFGAGASGAGIGGSGYGNSGAAGAAAGGGALGGAAGTGFAGSGPASGTTGASAGGATSVTFAQVSDIVVRVCASSMCHGGRENPNLSLANLYTTLTGTQVRQCGNDRLVAARDAANSALLEVVNGQCGNLVMPEGCDVLPCIGTSELTTITDWIAAGALP